MMGNSLANSHKQDLTTLSDSNNSTSQQNQQSVSLPASNIQNEQSNKALIESDNESLNKLDEYFSITSAGNSFTQTEDLIALINKLQFENEHLKVKQAVIDEKDKHLELCKDLINELREKCAIKDAQLTDKENLIKTLEAKFAENKSHLQSKLNELQEKCEKKSKHLTKKAKLIKNLKAEGVKRNVQLQSCLREINDLKAALDNKNVQLDRMKLAEKLQAKAAFNGLRDLNSMYDSSKLVNTLCNQGIQFFERNQYIEALVHYDSAIKLEKAKHNRPEALATLFLNKAVCYNLSKQYQQGLNSSNLALRYNPNYKPALKNRAYAYICLGQKLNALQDLEKAFQLDPFDEATRNSLEQIQELINATNSQ